MDLEKLASLFEKRGLLEKEELGLYRKGIWSEFLEISNDSLVLKILDKRVKVPTSLVIQNIQLFWMIRLKDGRLLLAPGEILLALGEILERR